MYLRWKEECIYREKQRGQINDFLQDKENLVTTITKLKEEFDYLKSELEGMAKYVHILNCGSQTLNEILEVGNVKLVLTVAH